MKKILFLAIATTLAFCASPPAEAQLLKTFKPVKDSAVNTDNTTISIGGVSSDVIAFFFKAEKVTGTVGGTATLQGSFDNTNWTAVGSAYTLTDIAHNQVVFEPSRFSWLYYRIYVASTGTMKINGIRGYTVRRTGG